jgi:cysteine desulfurase/selenocysteine lyase
MMINAALSPTRPGTNAAAPFDIERIRGDFPILSRTVHGKRLVYLDNANTSQKPAAVIDAESRFYREENANIHRGTHLLSQLATQAYEGARAKVQRFLGAAESKEIVFVRGTTEAINLVASSFGQARVKAGDEILISAMEHHSNIVPWQLLCQRTGASLRVVPMTDGGELLLDEYEKLLSPRTRLVSIVHISNALGTVNPVKRMIDVAHARGVPVLLDGAQAAPHMKVDVNALDCDFYAISGHKMFGPTGIGALYGKARWLEELPPYQGGGDMIASVTFEKTTYNVLPWKFEAGTANIAGGVGLGAAVDYLSAIGVDAIAAHEADLLAYGTERLSAIPGLRIVGTAREKASVLSFVIEGVHPHDIGTILDQEGVAIRTGHHCAQPVMDRLGLAATARASFAFYNTRDEIDALARALQKVVEIFG